MPHAMSIDSTDELQQAIVCKAANTAVLREDVSMPTLLDNEILVKVHAVAINPVDSKTLAFSSTPGAIGGCDFAGTIAGPASSGCRRKWPIGTRVCGLVMGCNPSRPSNGAFAEYVAAKSDLLIRIPDDMTFSTAATIGIGTVTSGIGLFKTLGLSFSLRTVTPSSPSVLVYGGSTASGTIAIQLLSLAGYRAIAVCSPPNFALVKRLGAVEAFDYHSPHCGKAIRAYTRDQLTITFDCITTAQSMAICYEAISRKHGGKYLSLDPFAVRVQKTRSDVHADWILAFTILGDEVALPGAHARPAMPEDFAFGLEWQPKIERLLAEGRLVPHPTTIVEGGLAGVKPALAMIAKGQVSGQKLVCNVIED